MSGVDSIWQSFANAQRIAGNIDAMVAELSTLLASNDLSFKTDPSEWDSDGQTDPGDWVSTYYLWTAPVRSRWKTNKLSQIGHLVVAVSLWRKEDEVGSGWSAARQAKLYVAFSPHHEEDLVQTLYLDGSGKNAYGTARPPYLWAFDKDASHVPWRKQPFMFCVVISKLESRDDLIREVITPLDRLLMSDQSTQSDAFRDVKFCQKIPAGVRSLRGSQRRS